LAVLELSPRWVIDISEDIQDFEIAKETTINSDSILPVGTLSSNLLSLNVAKFYGSSSIIKEYNRDSDIDPLVIVS
jgi:hypothetical protein